jgi:hypothetical protein
MPDCFTSVTAVARQSRAHTKPHHLWCSHESSFSKGQRRISIFRGIMRLVAFDGRDIPQARRRNAAFPHRPLIYANVDRRLRQGAPVSVAARHRRSLWVSYNFWVPLISNSYAISDKIIARERADHLAGLD